MLRCLKVWYELSNEVLFTAINLVDRFLTKMKVRPKHMACISVSSMHLAVKQLGLPVIDPEDLVAISQVSNPLSESHLTYFNLPPSFYSVVVRHVIWNEWLISLQISWASK